MPRPLATEAGLRGPGQEVWGEQMKAEVRSMVFEEDYIVVLRETGETEGGSWSTEYEPVATYDGRIDNVGNAGGEAKIYGEQINESTTHIISLPPDADVSASDRFKAEGKVWTTTSESVRTDQATTQLQVRELNG